MINRDLIAKYKARLSKELNPEGAAPEELEISYSRSYQIFKAEQISKSHLLFEKLCNGAEKILKIEISPKDTVKIEPSIKLAHLAITPASVYSLAYLTSIIVLVISMVAVVFTRSIAILMIALIAALSILYYIPTVPKKILTSWRARASDQLVLAVLYAVIFMEHTPNIEQAIRFVAEHMSPPISLDFMKILWDLESKVYSSAHEALTDYTSTWRGWDDEFVDSMNLVESSLYEGNEDRRKEILDKSVEVILEGTQDHMLTFAHNLQSPIESLHMLGVVLPVMGLVMLPMVSAFMGASIPPGVLMMLYDILLPITVFAIGASVLQSRPAGSDETDVYKFIQTKYARPAIKIGSFNLFISPRMLGLLAGILVGFPAIIYYIRAASLTAEQIQDVLFSQISIFASIDIVAAVGIGLGTYYWWSVNHLVKLKKSIEAIEQDFASSAFQLGERLEEHLPVELAFSKVAQTEKSEVAKLYRIVDYNLRELGMGLRSALFDEKNGALAFFPSATIRSAMSVLVEGAKKSPEIAGHSMITISRYLQAVHRVGERLKDLLADTTSSMQMQVKVFVPVIAGIVVGLAALTTQILRNLGLQLQNLNTISPEGAPPVAGTGLVDIFQISSMLPPTYFQLIVGVYVIELTIVLSVILSSIIYGHDKIEEKDSLGKNLFIATALYVAITMAVVILFGSLAAPISKMQFQ